MRNAEEEQKYIVELYEGGMSINQISKELNTYPNYVRRRLIKWGYEIRDKSEAMKLKVADGSWQNPTPKDSTLSEETKKKISEKVGEAWDKKSDEEIEEYRKKAKERWASMPIEEREKLIKMGASHIRDASVNGSKLERYLHQKFIEKGYKCVLHQENMVANEKLQMDLYLPELLTLIEVDGPSHFNPIWSEERLEKQQRADENKNGLVISAGMIMIRLKVDVDKSSRVFFEHCFDRLIREIHKIENRFPPENKRLIIVEPAKCWRK